ncbi:alpha/beta hydrolase [Planobispora siamensis]|uniref:Alpha/beta hydrolase family protein n=1 Tax=Planobispora siamensis TaxID=936338 RepID=A0A8J3WNR4_9ACTN|nr:alpha/beta hydrolase [Planobispora siamensis]GIH97654.1 hypothetical protein Psi01_82840 [Planobispora siamensis]
MSTIVVSHGYQSREDSVWFPAFRAGLEAAGHQVVIPNLPAPDAPEAGPWLRALQQAAAGAEPADTVLVGHSIGGVNVLRLLQAHDTARPFAGALLVSTASREVGYDQLAGFFDGGFDWDRICASARRFHVLTAIDDPVNVPDPIEHVADLVRGLGATALVLPCGGHLGAHHADHVDLPEATRLTLDLLGGDRPR